MAGDLAAAAALPLSSLPVIRDARPDSREHLPFFPVYSHIHTLTAALPPCSLLPPSTRRSLSLYRATQQVAWHTHRAAGERAKGKRSEAASDGARVQATRRERERERARLQAQAATTGPLALLSTRLSPLFTRRCECKAAARVERQQPQQQRRPAHLLRVCV